MVKRSIYGIAAATLAAGVLAAGAAASGHDVEREGTCTRASTWELELEREGRNIEVEFEVRQNRRGVRWVVTLRQNGKRVGSRTGVTSGRHGKFKAEFVTRNQPGVDRFVAVATRSGERCVGSAQI